MSCQCGVLMTVSSEDYVYVETVCVTEWLEKAATDADIAELSTMFNESQPSFVERLSADSEEENERLAELFEYAESRKMGLRVCLVNRRDFFEFLSKNKPHIEAMVG